MEINGQERGWVLIARWVWESIGEIIGSGFIAGVEILVREGSDSTPYIVRAEAAENDEVRKKLPRGTCNDVDALHVEINTCSGDESLKYIGYRIYQMKQLIILKIQTMSWPI